MAGPDRAHASKTFNAVVTAELLSHDQTGVAHENFLKCLWKACDDVGKKMYDDWTFHPPRLINTDCAGGLQNGALKSLAGEGHVDNRMMWANIVTPVMLWYEAQMLTWAVNMGTLHPSVFAIAIISSYAALFLHECRSHVYRAIKDWINSRDRGPDVKLLGSWITNMFQELAVMMTATDSLSKAMTLLSSFIVVLTIEWIQVDQFDMSSPTQDHHCRDKVVALAGELHKLKDELASTMLIHSKDEVEWQLNQI